MRRMNYVVGVTGVHSIANTAGLNVIRSLKDVTDADVETIAIDYNPLSSGFYTHVVDFPCVVTNPCFNTEKFNSEVVSLSNKFDLNYIIPTLDFEMRYFSQLRTLLLNEGISTLLPSIDSINIVNDKARFHDFCNKKRIPHPNTKTPRNVDELEDIAKDIGFPMALKGYVRGCYIANDIDEAKVFYRRLEKWSQQPPIIQEYIQGDQYCCAGIADQDHSVKGAVQMRKLGLAESGASLAAVTMYDPDFLAIVINLVREVGWTGPFEVECIYSEIMREYLLIEFNSRFPAWIYLATKAGVNLPWITIKTMENGKTAVSSTYKTGLVYVRNAWDIIFPASKLFELLIDREKTIDRQENEKPLVRRYRTFFGGRADDYVFFDLNSLTGK
jgi:carbamoyl-phosphate synthase large subunit